MTHPQFDRITYDPKMMAGKACIRGMRITVALVLNLLAADKTPGSDCGRLSTA